MYLRPAQINDHSELAGGTIGMYLKNINYFLESIGNKNLLEITRKCETIYVSIANI